MTTQELNVAFLNSLDSNTLETVLNNIANHYGITQDEAFSEVTDKESENIMDYITGSIRPAVSLLFNKFKASESKCSLQGEN
jgi:hypothetical protein